MYVIRKKSNNEAVNVSYSPDGLMWTTNTSGQLLACKNASIKVDLSSSNDYGYTNYTVTGDTRFNNNYYIEPFKFRHFKNKGLQSKEEKMARKCVTMTYSSWANGTSMPSVK